MTFSPWPVLVGELGSDPGDPPVEVEVDGHVDLDGGGDAHGLRAAVTPLADGPSPVLALGLAPGTIRSECPATRGGSSSWWGAGA